MSAQTASDSVARKFLQVDCPAGKRVIGGGTDVLGPPNVVTIDSHPRGTTGWLGDAGDVAAPSPPWSLIVYAICASAAP